MGAKIVYPSEEQWKFLRDIMKTGNGILLVSPEAQKKIAAYGIDREVNGFHDPNYDFGGEPDVLVDVLRAYDLPESLEDAKIAIEEHDLDFQARPVFRALGLVTSDD